MNAQGKRYMYRALVTATGAVFLVGTMARAWTGPPSSPPNANVAAPINVGSSLQEKTGGFYVSDLLESDTLAVYGNTILGGTSRYLNWGTTVGTTGYGIRDNGGTMEFKNSGGSWTSFGAGGSLPWLASGNNIYNTNTGNVGIGTAGPLTNLHVAGTSGLHLRSFAGSPEGGRITWLGDGTGWKLHMQARNDAGTLIGATPIMTLVDNGNVGIGTASPGAALQVGSGSVGGIGGIQARGATASYISASNDGNSAIAFMGSDTSAAGIFGTLSNYAVVLRTNNTDRIRIETTGNVGINSASPDAKLRVNAIDGMTVVYGHNSSNGIGVRGYSASGVGGYFQSAGANYGAYAESTGNYGMYGRTLHAGYGGVLGYAANGTYYGILGHANAYSFYGNGPVASASFLYVSDKRLKENIKPLDIGLAELMKLKPVSFTWKKEVDNVNAGKDDFGLIAQDIEKVLPDLVMTDTSGKKSIDYVRLVPLLIQSVQEQQVEIERGVAHNAALQKEIDVLKTRLSILESNVQ